MPIRPHSRRVLTRLGFALLLPLAAACEKKLPPKPPEQLVLEAVSFSDIPGWAEDNVVEVLPARSAARRPIGARPARLLRRFLPATRRRPAPAWRLGFNRFAAATTKPRPAW